MTTEVQYFCKAFVFFHLKLLKSIDDMKSDSLPSINPFLGKTII